MAIISYQALDVLMNYVKLLKAIFMRGLLFFVASHSSSVSCIMVATGQVGSVSWTSRYKVLKLTFFTNRSVSCSDPPFTGRGKQRSTEGTGG